MSNMLEYTAADVLMMLESSKNLNAAIKKFLKNDVGNEPRNERFIKSLKQIMLSKDSAAKEAFISKHLPDYEQHFFILGRYACLEPVDTITQEIVEKYADEFNSTYSKNEKGLEFKNADRFNQIVLEVNNLIVDRLKALGLAPSNFMKNILFFIVFDAEVLEYVIPKIKAA